MTGNEINFHAAMRARSSPARAGVSTLHVCTGVLTESRGPAAELGGTTAGATHVVELEGVRNEAHNANELPGRLTWPYGQM
jgi:hypothetical protein